MSGPPPELGWDAQIDYDEGGRWQRLTWRLPAAALRQALTGPGAGRSARAPRLTSGRSVLLLSDVQVLEGELLATNVLAHPEPGSDSLSLEVIVTTERDVTPNLVCRLTSVARSHSIPLSSSGAVFNQVRPAEINGGLTISFERPAPAG